MPLIYGLPNFCISPDGIDEYDKDKTSSAYYLQFLCLWLITSTQACQSFLDHEPTVSLLLKILESEKFNATQLAKDLTIYILSVLLLRVEKNDLPIVHAIKRSISLELLVSSCRCLQEKNDELFPSFYEVLQRTEHQLIGFISDLTLSPGNSLIIDKSKYTEELDRKNQEITRLKFENQTLKSKPEVVRIDCASQTEQIDNSIVTSGISLPDVSTEATQKLLNIIVEQQTYIKMYQSSLGQVKIDIIFRHF